MKGTLKMKSDKTSLSNRKRRGLWVAFSSLCLTGLVAYLTYFIAFHQTFDPYLEEDVQKQVFRLSDIEDLALPGRPSFVTGDIYENGEKVYFFQFYSAGVDSPLLSLKETRGEEERLYQAEWNGESKASEFHYIEGDDVEKTFKTLTYKELLATFLSFPLDPDCFCYQSRMKSLSFDRKENWVKTKASPKGGWRLSLPKMEVVYDLPDPTFEFSFHPMDEYLQGDGVFGFRASGDCGETEVQVVLSFYRGDYQKTLS